MEKRGQFYIILAVILALGIFGVVSESNKAEQPVFTQDFSELSQNYLRESPKVVNYAIYQKEDVNSTLSGFTEDFLQQARKTNPGLSILYIYSNGSEVKVRSYLDESTVIYSEDRSAQLLFGQSQVAIQRVILNISGKEFIHEVPVTIRNFGEEFFQSSGFSEPQSLRLDIGGIFHTFNLESNNIPQLQVLVQSKEGDVKEVYSTGDPSHPFVP